MANKEPNDLRCRKILDRSLRSLNGVSKRQLRSQGKEQSMDLSFSSCVPLFFDLSVELRAILASFFPPFEHIGSIGIKLALPFSPPLHFGKCARFEPFLHSSCAQIYAMSDLCLLEALCVKGHHLLIAVIALCAPCQTSTFSTVVWCGFPGFHGKCLFARCECLSCFWRDLLTGNFFSIFADLGTTTS